MDKSGADGFRDDVLLMREVLEDWCALHGVRPTAPPQSKLRRSCSGRAGTFAGNSYCRLFLRWRQPTGRSESRRFGNETSHVYGSQGAAAFVASVLDICLSASCDPVLSVSGVERR